MHPFDLIILVSIACCAGFIPAIYVKKDVVLAVGYFVASTIGVFTGGYLALWYLPQSDKPGILFGGIFGAVLLVISWHITNRHRDHDRC